MKKSTLQKFQVTGYFFVAFLEPNLHFCILLNQNKPYLLFALEMPQGGLYKLLVFFSISVVKVEKVFMYISLWDLKL